MKTSHLSLLTLTVLLGQFNSALATTNPTCQSKKLVDSSLKAKNCWLTLDRPESTALLSSISVPEWMHVDDNHLLAADNQAGTSSNLKDNSQPDALFDRQISLIPTLLLDLTLSPLGAIAFFLLIKPLMVKILITDIREKISELGQLELQLSTASQQAEKLSNDFQIQLDNLANESQTHFENLKQQANQQGLAVQKFESIKSDWMSQLQTLVLEVYDARDRALEKIAHIGSENLSEKMLETVYDRLRSQVENSLGQARFNGEVGSPKATDRDYMRQGNQLLEQGYYSDALIAYNQAIALNSNDAEAWDRRGSALGCLQQYQQALASYQRAIALAPERAEIWANRGHILMRLQEYNEALASYENAIKIESDRAEYWQYQGNLFAKLKKYPEAIHAYEQASVLEPKSYEVWHLKGNLLTKLKKIEESVIAYKQAVAIDPQKYESWYNLGNALGQLERYVESVNAYNQAIDLKGSDFRVWHNRGFMLGKMQRYEAAIASYDKATSLNPQNYESWYNRGNLLEQLHHYDEAIASYDKAIEIKPDDPRLWYNCGKILEKLQRYEEALVSYERAIEMQPDRSEEVRVSLKYLLAKLHHDPSVWVS